RLQTQRLGEPLGRVDRHHHDVAALLGGPQRKRSCGCRLADPAGTADDEHLRGGVLEQLVDVQAGRRAAVGGLGHFAAPVADAPTRAGPAPRLTPSVASCSARAATPATPTPAPFSACAPAGTISSCSSTDGCFESISRCRASACAATLMPCSTTSV